MFGLVVQNLQPQLIKTGGEVEALMVRIAKEKAEVVQPKAAAVGVDEAAAQAKVMLHPIMHSNSMLSATKLAFSLVPEQGSKIAMNHPCLS